MAKKKVVEVNCLYCGKPYPKGAALASHIRGFHAGKPYGYEGGPEPKSSPPVKKEEPIEDQEPEEIPEYPWLMWDRGTYRGWATAWVSSRTPEIVSLKTPHLGSISWPSSALEGDLKSGKVFYVNPDQVAMMLAEQMSNLQVKEEHVSGDPAEELDQIIKHLREAAYLMKSLRDRET